MFSRPIAGSSPPQSHALSAAVTATSVGTWCFSAVYVPADDSNTTECFTVNVSTSTASEQTWLPNDSGTVTSTGGTALNGTLSFTLYSGGDCSGTILRAAEEFTFTTSRRSRRGARRTPTSPSTTMRRCPGRSCSTASSDLVADSEHCEKTTLHITN